MKIDRYSKQKPSRKQRSGCLVWKKGGEGHEKGMIKGQKESLKVIDLFNILIFALIF